MLVSIVCYFLLFSDALAFNVIIYKSADYFNHQEPEPAYIVEETFMFEFNQNNQFVVDVRLKNKSPDVVARVFVTWHPTNGLPGDIEKETMTTKKCKNEDCLSIKSRKFKSISISIQFEKENVECASQLILEGNATSKNETVGSLCQPSCAVVMDVQNECQGPTESPVPNNTSNDKSSVTAGLLTGLAVVMGVAAIVGCVVILHMKKCCRVKSTSEEPPQTYVARNPFYVNLLFRKECQAEIYAAEHVYEEIN